ncbi:hypothetical protein K144313037_p10590 (plasmid) [Clostridium tetani]|nr:hypothetical protein K144313037_p10590 [Clostridium tetani]BDR79733.1 hypothetical protein K154307017_p10590 [Clostridium tetani]BDR85369.1 hypothetical protein K254310026_p10580 [Clostridium tetani]BEV20829.1 hypothetical protein K154301001_26840 [Clostridium tetani]SUY80126.1 Uncharacterised protein [Clostridium tetani]
MVKSYNTNILPMATEINLCIMISKVQNDII